MFASRSFRHLCLLAALVFPSLARSADKEVRKEDNPPPEMQLLRTPAGVRYGLFGKKPAAPAPTLFIFATGVSEMTNNVVYTETGRRLAPHGFLYVAVDPPCHGEDVKPKEPPQLRGWRHRLENGDALIADFTARTTAILDHLVKEGYTDPERVGACGTSRGGFLAFHFAAADPRVKAVTAISPVTDLLALSEFKGMEKHEATRALSLENSAPKLAGRAAWISIGNSDDRVNSDAAIAFSRKLVAAGIAARKNPKQVIPVELLVGPSDGHSAVDRAYELAAAWMVMQFPKNTK